jgi:hypothetical protein
MVAVIIRALSYIAISISTISSDAVALEPCN